MATTHFPDEIEKSIGKYDATTSIAVNDQISKLPEPLLHEILSLLLPEEAARMAVLSKTWLRAVESQGLIDLDHHYPERYGEETNERIMSIVHEIESKHKQNNRKIAIRRFSLSISPTTDEYQGDLEISSLFQFLSMHTTVQMIVIEVQGYAGVLDISDLLPSITNTESLATLNLKGFCFERAIPLGGPDCLFKMLPSLRKLSLVECRVGNDQLRIILVNCPFLEILHLDRLAPLSSEIEIPAPHLRSLSLEFSNPPQEVKIIGAPGLRRYSYSGERFIPLHHCLNSLSQQEVHLTIRLSCESDTTWFSINLRYTLAMLTQFITVVQLDLQNIGSVQFRPNELGIFSRDPTPARPNCLKLIGMPSHELDYAALLDCLLWSIHPTTLFFQCPNGRSSSDRFMKFLFHELTEATKQNPFCCGVDQNLTCWRHDLRKANLDNRGQLSIKFKLEWY